MSKTGLDLHKIANTMKYALPLATTATIAAGIFADPLFYGGTALFGTLTAIDQAMRKGQKEHTILRNFGIFGWGRYVLESLGPELRQYIVANDTEENPFSRRERGEIYKLAKDEPVKTESFGTTLEGLIGRDMIRHSMFPIDSKDVERFSLTFGQDKSHPYTITNPVMISAMSYGALGKNAVEALSYGAKQAGIALNTGEGGFPKHHLSGGADLIFQIGTAKFGCRKDNGSLDETLLKKIADLEEVKMVEMKLSQGAKPGKGGILPAAKVTPEIAELRGVLLNKDVYSPSRHIECDTPENSVKFIEQVQKATQLPVGIKIALGNEQEFSTFIDEMITQDVFPDYIAVDGAEGGTGASPRSFMDYVGIPLFPALKIVNNILQEKGVRDRTKIIASGKLIDPGRQFKALAYGADAIYSARAFLLSLGCIQAMQCNSGSCPAGITTHNTQLQSGLIVEEKARRIANYSRNAQSILYELVGATGCTSFDQIGVEHIYTPKN